MEGQFSDVEEEGSHNTDIMAQQDVCSVTNQIRQLTILFFAQFLWL